MRQPPGRLARLVWAAAALAPTAAWAAESPSRLFLLDGRAPALHVVDAGSGKVQQTLALSGSPSLLLATPDGSRLLVLDRGPGKEAGDRGWASTGRSAVTVVDADTMQVIGRVELGWGLSLDHAAEVTADGRRLAVVCPGYQAKKVDERKPSELVVVDIEGAKEAGRVPLDRAPAAWTAGPDGHSVYALLPRPDAKESPGGTASLVAVDVASAAAHNLPLEGEVTDLAPSPDGRLLYLLDRGKPSGKVEKNVNGRLHVISLDSFSPLGVLDAGSGPLGVFFEETSQALLLMARAAPVKGAEDKGELRVVRGAKVDATIPLAADPLFLRRSPDGRHLLAVSEKSLKVLDVPSFTAVRDVPIEGGGKNWTSNTQPGPPNDLAVSPDGTRGLLTYENASKLLILDLTSGAKVASVTTGRKSAKLGKMAEVTAMNAASYYSAQEDARRSGQTWFSYSVYDVRAASTAIALRADGLFAYVLNTLTNDVTIVDIAGATALEKIPVGGREIRPLPTGRFLTVASDSALEMLDTTTNALAGKWELPGLVGLAVAPDRPAVVAVAEKSLVALDPATGKVTGRTDSFVGNADWRFVVRRLPAPKAETAETKPAVPADAPKPNVKAPPTPAKPKPKPR